MYRQDYSFPFRIDASSRQAQRAAYEAHVGQMVRQVLLTTPGERVNLPEFGCGLRQLVFAPRTAALDSSVKLIVLSALDRWLSDHIQVREVRTGGDPNAGELSVDIDYILRETNTATTLQIQLGAS